MRRTILSAFTLLLMWGSASNTQAADKSVDTYPVYKGEGLELSYRPQGSTFRLWSPGAEAVRLHLYTDGVTGEPERSLSMQRAELGSWLLNVEGELRGKFYTFQIQHNGTWLQPTPGIWAKAVGMNGTRAAILDLRQTDPEGWITDQRPPLTSPTDIVVYEMHHRDLSISPTAGSRYPGKYLALTQRGTTSPEGHATGLDHLRELGVTHVHLLPSYDYASVDESRPQDNQYNWGYDPQNYNAVEGSYATNAVDPAVRIREFKQMVKSLHENGIRVIMDVVYNHTYDTGSSAFELTAPGYFYRHLPDGSCSNASGCGNETASEREMMRHYIVESVKFWATEYHIDGFRFDLMGIHDIETMNAVRRALDEIDPSIFIYGEGWTAGDSPLPVEQRALKAHGKQMPRIALFSDDLRDALRGSWADARVPGFASGQLGLTQSIRFGVVGATGHPQVDFTQVNYSRAPFANTPAEVINYASCHDDLSLVDKLREAAPADVTPQELIRFNKLAQTVVFTSQGVPFIYAGEEILRNKKGVHNSYQSPDSINAIDWSFKHTHSDVYDYYRGLIALRRAHPAFRMNSAQHVAENLTFLDNTPENVVAYTLNGAAVGDSWKQIMVVYNGARTPQEIELPVGTWTVVCRQGKINLLGLGTLPAGTTTLSPSSALIIYQP